MLLVALAALCSLPACGAGDGPDVLIETSDPSPDEVSLRAPATANAGLVEIELRNHGDTPHDAQLFRVDGERTAADVVAVLEGLDSDPKPRWLHPMGGVAPVAPDETAIVRQVLGPGTYYVADTQERVDPSGVKVTNAAKKGIARVQVEGDDAGRLPPTPATITARDDGFDISGIAPGTNAVTFRNAGGEFHQVIAFPLSRDPSYRVAKAILLGQQSTTGWVPVDVPHDRATTVLEAGDAQTTEMTFRQGRYLLLCFVSPRTGGDPQWKRGMTAELDVATRAAEPGAGGL